MREETETPASSAKINPFQNEKTHLSVLLNVIEIHLYGIDSQTADKL